MAYEQAIQRESLGDIYDSTGWVDLVRPRLSVLATHNSCVGTLRMEALEKDGGLVSVSSRDAASDLVDPKPSLSELGGMMPNNFFITGTGRCGSLWLAHALDDSLKDWTVRQEQWYTGSVFDDLRLAQDWLNLEPKRGVIDCTLRPVADMFVAERRVVLLRNPVSVWSSARRRNKKDRRFWTPDSISGMCHRIDSLIRDFEFTVMRFERAIKDPSYVAAILGVQLDQNWTVPKMNASPIVQDMATGMEALVRIETRWFADKYDLEEI